MAHVDKVKSKNYLNTCSVLTPIYGLIHYNADFRSILIN